MSDDTLHRAYLALGSNIEPEHNLPAVVRELSRYGRVLGVSRVWETEPLGFSNQPNFLNAALLLETSLTAGQLRQSAIPDIERVLNRQRDPENPNGPRTIDVDIALFDCEIIVIGSRRIPDPDILERAFVAVPLAELDPGYVHPENGRTLAEIAGGFAQAQSSMIVRPDVQLAVSPLSPPGEMDCESATSHGRRG